MSSSAAPWRKAYERLSAANVEELRAVATDISHSDLNNRLIALGVTRQIDRIKLSCELRRVMPLQGAEAGESPYQPPPLKHVRVAFIASANLFVYDGGRISNKSGLVALPARVRYETRQTGGMLATMSLVRYLRRHVSVDVLAIETLDESMKSHPTATSVEAWEGGTILRGSAEALEREVAGRGSYGLTICALLEPRMVCLALRLDARRRAAMVHDHSQIPWGPWTTCDTGRCQSWVEVVCGLDALLCTSQDVARYATHHAPVRRAANGTDGSAPVALAVTAADYHHVGTPERALADNSLPLRPWEKDGTHAHVTLVSPCAMKGLGVLLRLAHQLPSVSFLAVQTSWTKVDERGPRSRPIPIWTHHTIHIHTRCWALRMHPGAQSSTRLPVRACCRQAIWRRSRCSIRTATLPSSPLLPTFGRSSRRPRWRLDHHPRARACDTVPVPVPVHHLHARARATMPVPLPIRHALACARAHSHTPMRKETSHQRAFTSTFTCTCTSHM